MSRIRGSEQTTYMVTWVGGLIEFVSQNYNLLCDDVNVMQINF